MNHFLAFLTLRRDRLICVQMKNMWLWNLHSLMYQLEDSMDKKHVPLSSFMDLVSDPWNKMHLSGGDVDMEHLGGWEVVKAQISRGVAVNRHFLNFNYSFHTSIHSYLISVVQPHQRKAHKLNLITMFMYYLNGLNTMAGSLHHIALVEEPCPL